MSGFRRTVLMHGRRVYADSIKTKDLSTGGTVIVYADDVSSFDRDWDPAKPPEALQLRFNEPGADKGPRQ